MTITDVRINAALWLLRRLCPWGLGHTGRRVEILLSTGTSTAADPRLVLNIVDVASLTTITALVLTVDVADQIADDVREYAQHLREWGRTP